MSTRLVTAILAKNEAAPDRYLERVIHRCFEFSDAVLLVDDGSTDTTRDIASAAGCSVMPRTDAGFWGKSEAPARRDLWERAAEIADDGWILVADADMLLHGDPRPLLTSWDVTAWAFPLVDLWDSEETFRVDGPWGYGPRSPRPWLFRPSALTEPAQWSDRPIHVGHAPANFPGPIGVAPDLHWRHLGWKQRSHRLQKAQAYANVAHQLSEFERQHASTILD